MHVMGRRIATLAAAVVLVGAVAPADADRESRKERKERKKREKEERERKEKEEQERKEAPPPDPEPPQPEPPAEDTPWSKGVTPEQKQTAQRLLEQGNDLFV